MKQGLGIPLPESQGSSPSPTFTFSNSFCCIMWLWKEICWKAAALLKQIKYATLSILKTVAWDSEYLLCSLVSISCFIINVLLKIMNYEFLYSFLLEQITSMYALRGYHKSLTATPDCFLLSNQQCLTTQPHFSCTTILKNHCSF